MKTRLVALSFALAATACGKDSTKPEGTKPAPTALKADQTRLEIRVTEKGFEPEDVQVPAGKPVTFVFTRKSDQTCVKEVTLTLADGTKIEKALPLGKPVELAATFPTAGKLGYACGMDMVKGTITVQ